MKSSFLPTFAVLLLCGYSLAQDSPSKTPPQTQSAASPAGKVNQDPETEIQFRQQQLARMKREHSDDKGQLRPDLFAKGAAQVQRMKVVSEPGAAPKTQPADKP